MGGDRVGARRATMWVLVDAVVVMYALIPVLWILSLSLKPTSMVKDGRLIPSSVSFDNYRGIFRGDLFHSAPACFLGSEMATTAISVLHRAIATDTNARPRTP